MPEFTFVNLTYHAVTNSDGAIYPVGTTASYVDSAFGTHWDATDLATNTTAGTVGHKCVSLTYSDGGSHSSVAAFTPFEAFMMGFSLVFIVGMLGVGARWVRHAIGGSHNE